MSYLISTIIHLKRLIQIVCGLSKGHVPINIVVVERDPKMKWPKFLLGCARVRTKCVEKTNVGLWGQSRDPRELPGVTGPARVLGRGDRPGPGVGPGQSSYRSGQQKARALKIKAQIVGLGPFSRSVLIRKNSKCAELMGLAHKYS